MRFICCFLFTLTAFSQSVVWEGSVSASGLFSTEDASPFWISKNTDTRWGEETTFSGFGEIRGSYALTETSEISGGASFFYRNEVQDEFQRRDIYAQFTNSWLNAVVGAKKGETVMNGLSTTNKNFLFSQNARPLSGVLLEASEPLKITDAIGIDWGIGHYWLNDDRYVDDVLVHYKRLGLHIKINENNTLTAQIQHYAQWAGTSPDFGELPSGFDAFVDVFLAKESSESGEAGEIVNAVGNHLGSYLLDYSFGTSVGDFSLYHEHPFEDGSGTALKNLPDGVWGIHFVPSEKKIVSGVLYEYVSTDDQGVGSQLAGADNYFSNNIYRSGWTYDGAIIGVPFVLVDPTREITSETSPIVSNRAKVHHFGVHGEVSKFSWLFKTSIAKHLGTYNNPFPSDINLLHNYLSVMYKTDNYGNFRLFSGLDSGKTIDTTFGLGVDYTYSF
ncbi:capsule assembly Wzi family protein [Aureisphaera galaxeae]|uniref:capsule assembly Wzi family protein n=1 Tax=Aureisphaera galaxeae TaxID=1538023 RepID=UPI00235044D4|nr:capsule assembly Wzi family protein [Aureisphaera galaxeae]MDC8004581.1 capsule assembly Wzi family protein [Aureisphaera galaxeae]